MPYIDQQSRQEIPTNRSCATAGELNYVVTCLVLMYLTDKGLSYQTCNDIVGALDNAKDEFRRRVQHPYENSKMAQNGDVYP